MCTLVATSFACSNEQRVTPEPASSQPASSQPASSQPAKASATPVPAIATADAPAGEPKDVSVIQLLATPERFRGQHVRVGGYVTLEFEGNAIYLHKEDYVRNLMWNAIWLDLPASSNLRLKKPGYAIIEGRYDPDKRGHMGIFSGALVQINRLDAWAGRDQ